MAFTDIINVIHQVQGKFEKISSRNELFEHNFYYNLKQQNKKSGKNIEDEFSEDKAIKNLGARSSMDTINDLIVDAHKHFSTNQNAKSMGYLVSYPEYQAIQFLQINYTILNEEFNSLKH